MSKTGMGEGLHPLQAEIARLSGTDATVGFEVIYGAELTDITGVPMNSDRSVLPAAKTIDWRYRPATFKASPSRTEQDKPISGLELERFARSSRLITGTAQYLRRIQFEATGQRASLQFGDAVALASMVKHLSHYLVFRKHEPIAHDQLPVELAVMHNAATGMISGLFGWHDKVRDIRGLNYVPRPGLVARNVEESGRLVGGKTVCVARPEVIDNSMATLVHGTGKGEVPGWLEALLPPSEVSRLAEFAIDMFMCGTEYREAQMNDHDLYELIKAGVPDLHKFVAAHDLLKAQKAASIASRQPSINFILGRRPGSPPVMFNNRQDFVAPAALAALKAKSSTARQPGKKRKR